MPSRFDKHKPDPAIKRNVMRARAGMQDMTGERAIVVVGSLAATIAAWVVLSLPNLSTPAAVQVSDTNQAAITVTAQTSSSSDSTISTSTSTATSTPQASLPSGVAASLYSSQSATTSQATTSGNSVQTTQAVAVTRSSR
jgi:hypothetical protein